MNSFSGKSVLVTGASSGIGKSFAESLARRGANLIITARSVDKLEALAASLRSSAKVSVDVIGNDLGEPGSAARLMQEIKSRGLAVDVLINNAGFGTWGKFLDQDPATYNNMLQLNITSLVELTQLCLPDMLSKGSGGIINVGSTASYVPVPYAATYSASKAFVLYFSEALYGEYKDKGVTVTCLCPGNTASNFATVASGDGSLVNTTGRSPDEVADIGLDAFLEGEPSVLADKSKAVALMPRFLPRKRVIKIVGDTWKKLLVSRGMKV